MLPQSQIRLAFQVVAGGAILLATVPAQAGLIIDDFTDPAEIRLPEGPSSVVTEGVGDLNATRTVSFREIWLEPGQIAHADVGVSVPGQYVAAVDDARRRMYVDAEYSFEGTDLTQGGVNDAFFVDFTFAEGMITTFPQTGDRLQPPGVRLIAHTTSFPYLLVGSFNNAHTAPFPNNQAPYTLIAPFEDFSDLGGGGVHGLFSDIVAFELWLSASGPAGPWEVRIDSIRVGRATPIPEPATFTGAAIVIMCVLAVHVVPPFFNRWN